MLIKSTASVSNQNSFLFPQEAMRVGAVSFALALCCSTGGACNASGLSALPPTGNSVSFTVSGLNHKKIEYNGSTFFDGCGDMSSLVKNLSRLEVFSGLNKNWNNNGADPIPGDLISDMKYLLFKLDVQPDIFPTACDSIQFEYEKSNGDYLEFELRENRVINVFKMNSDGTDCEFQVKFDPDTINKVVKEFYDG